MMARNRNGYFGNGTLTKDGLNLFRYSYLKYALSTVFVFMVYLLKWHFYLIRSLAHLLGLDWK